MSSYVSCYQLRLTVTKQVEEAQVRYEKFQRLKEKIGEDKISKKVKHSDGSTQFKGRLRAHKVDKVRDQVLEEVH